MDYLFGVILFIFVILLIFRFATISITDTPRMQPDITNDYYLFSIDHMTRPTGTPQPTLAQSKNNNNSVSSSKEPIYNYNKYFFVKG